MKLNKDRKMIFFHFVEHKKSYKLKKKSSSIALKIAEKKPIFVKKRDKLKFDIYTKTCDISLNTLVIDMIFFSVCSS